VWVAAVILSALFVPSIAGHVAHSMNPHVFNGDAAQWVFPFFRYTEDAPVGVDVPGDYHLAIMPVGFRGLYQVLSPFVDPASISKVLPYLLLSVTLLGVGMSAGRMAGPHAGLIAAALALSAPHFLNESMGGLPRSFAFPLLALGAWALSVGHGTALAALVVLAQAFYPVAGVLLGLMLAGLLLVISSANRGRTERWSLQKRLSVVLLAAGVSIALFVPTAVTTKPWGRLLAPTDARIYPEVGPGGRWDDADMPSDRMPVPGVFLEIQTQFVKALDRDGGAPVVAWWQPAVQRRKADIVAGIAMALAAGVLLGARRDAAVRRMVLLPLTGALAYVVARLAVPYFYMPPRYVQYSLPLFVVIMLPVAGVFLARAVAKRHHALAARSTGAVAAGMLVMLTIGGRGDAVVGHDWPIGGNAAVFDYLAALPPDVLIAGWPGGIIENVPFYCHRRALVNEETDKAGHAGYVLEMRGRKRALAAALFGDADAALSELRNRYGVTHLIVDRRAVEGPPTYYAPIGAEATDAWHRGKARGFAVERVRTKTTVFQHGDLAVLDLSRL
jgi:hypothetical protein